MKIGQAVFVLLATGIFSAFAFAENGNTFKVGARKTDLDVVNEFLAESPSDSLWVELLDTAPVYGNYCGLKEQTMDFDAPCLNTLDCTCKARQLASGIRTYRVLDFKFLENQLGVNLEKRADDKNWQPFLNLVTVKLFAAKVVSVDVSEGVLSCVALYETDKNKSLGKLLQIIDENEVFRRKIEEVRVEKLRFEEQGADGGPKPAFHPRAMAISIQPLNLIFGLFLINWENRISDVFSFRLGASVYATGLITDTYLGYGNNNKDFSTFLNLGLKGFVQGKTLSNGLYLEPNLEVGYEVVASATNPGVRDRDIAFVPGLVFGLEKVFSSGFQIDVGIGGGYHFGIAISDGPFTKNFLVPKLRAALGFSW